MRFEFRAGRSAKFWEPARVGRAVLVRFGRIGTVGQARRTEFASPAAAQRALTALIAEKRAKGYRRAAGGRAAARSAPRPGGAAGWTPTRRAALLELAAALGGTKAAVVRREVALAAEDPARYLASTRHERFAAWDADATAALPWLALIEALEAVGRLAEIDWKEAGSEICTWLARLGGAAARRALAGDPASALDERRTEEALELFGLRLGEAGLALLILDVDSDSYPLVVVPAAAVPRLVAQARAARQRITPVTGARFAALEAARLRRVARDRVANPWRQLVLDYEHARGTDSAVAAVLHHLRHDRDGALAARITAALPFVPPRDRPRVALALALNAGDAAAVARTARDPALALRALDSVRDEDPRGRLRAAAVLAVRLRVRPDRGAVHRALGDALNLWAEPDRADAALAALPAADRTRLARLADALLAVRSLWNDAGRALANVGDATSLALLRDLDARRRAEAIAYAAKHPSFSAEPWGKDAPIPRAIARIERRLRGGARAARPARRGR